MAVLGASSLQIDSATLGPISGSAPMYAARAWVNFNGTTSPGTIRASGNVSSVTRNGTGDFSVNFVTAMPDVNYAPNVTVSRGDSNVLWHYDIGFTPTTTSYRFTVSCTPNGTVVGLVVGNPTNCFCSFFR